MCYKEHISGFYLSKYLDESHSDKIKVIIYFAPVDEENTRAIEVT